MVVLFPEPINPKAEAVLVSNGLTMKEHVSEPLVREDFDDRTLVLAFSQATKEKMIHEFELPEGLPIYLLNEYVKQEQTVTNPYGGTLADYGQCFSELEVLIKRLVVQLNEEELLC
jgi:protein-tyrosine-phosphatase